ncbi:CPBP family intramembrane glutamic endopeptidase [Holzapfeliella floricola]|uniref:CAAX prenyl protease 2/Lysostaphin resistance protein A-like domain-containing protein n=1 Tax=Holzapfeliella floricola DSM 23037 = JCM 16512 TaxID=1423744 RepID=A0A0R2DJ29_9LACO|nr:type II CAAX endopeptidase family protein [Holzapfeliella floricola]KRN04098.1 hypothetical protein FC86_GL000470 [Holzapfeliella floricola DSM 23037 = JCM 16512]
MSKSVSYVVRLIMAVVVFFVDQLLLVFLQMPKEVMSLGYVLGIVLRLAVAAVVVYGIYRYYRYLLEKDNPRQFMTKQTKFGFDKVMLVLGLFVVLIIVQVVINLVLLKNQPESANQVKIIEFVKGNNFLFGLFVVVIGPILEEIIFRGLFFDLFFKQSSNLKNTLGIILNGLLFGLAHTSFQFNLSLVTYAVMGMMFAAIYLKTKDLRCSTGVHMLNNLLSFIGILFAK